MATFRAVEALHTRTPGWLVAQYLRVRADQLEVDFGVADHQAELMRARADAICASREVKHAAT